MKVLIDEDVIRKLASSTKIYMRGRNIFNAKQRIGPLFYDANKQLISAKVSSLSGNVYDTFMQLNNNGSLAGAGCSCAAFGIFKGPCKHVIALLFHLIDTELPDEGLTPEPLKVEDILYGTPNLNQPILSFDVLERIISPDEKKRRRSGGTGRNTRKKSTGGAYSQTQSSTGTNQGLLQDNTVATGSGETEFIKIRPGHNQNLIIEEQPDGTEIIKTKPRMSGGEELIKQVKFWNLSEENNKNDFEDVLALDRLTMFEVTISLDPNNSDNFKLSMRVGNKGHLYVVPRIGDFIEKLKTRETIEFGSYFTWHKKQTLTKTQNDFLNWLEDNFIESQARVQAQMTTAEIFANQDLLDSKAITLSPRQLASFLSLELQEAEEIEVLVSIGNMEFPLVWRQTWPQNMYVYLYLLNEKEAAKKDEAENAEGGESANPAETANPAGATNPAEATSPTQASATDKPNDRNETLGLDVRQGSEVIPIYNIADLESTRQARNSIVMLPIRNVFLLDAVLYYCDTEQDRLLYSILEVLAEEENSVIELIPEEASYMLGTSSDVWQDNSKFAISNKLRSELVHEDLLIKTYIDYDGSKVNLSAFFSYGEYSFRPGYAEKKIISSEEDTDVVLLRDIGAEKRFTKLLYDLGFDEANLKEHELAIITKSDAGDYMANQYYLQGDDKVFRFVNGNTNKLSEQAKRFATPNFRKIQVKKPGKTSMKLGLSDDEAYLRLEISIKGIESEDTSKIVGGFLAKKDFVKLDKQTFVDLSNNPNDENNWSDALEDLKSLVATLESWEVKWEDNAFIMPRVRSLSLFTALDENNISVSSEIQELNDAWQKLVEDTKNPGLRGPDLPEGVNTELRPYQLEGYQWISYLDRYGLGGILADEMGLGKTVQMLSFLWSIYKDEPGQYLVVAPTSLLYNWQKETEKFVPGLKAQVINGTKGERIDQYKKFKNETGIMIVSYGLVRQDRKELGQFNFETIVLDEAQYIKNPMTKTSRSVKSLKGKRRFALTGTPLENHIGELWSIFDFIMPGYLFNYSSFQDRFGILFKAPEVSKLSRAQLEEISADELANLYDGNMEANRQARESLRQLVSPFIMRRLKKDVLNELPDKLTTDIPVPMTRAQQDVYREHLTRARNQITEYNTATGKQQNTHRMNILGELTRLRQICCHPALFMNDYDGGSGKLEVLEDLVDNLLDGGHRILLFSQFTKMLGIIQERQESRGRNIFYIDGQVPSEERIRLVDDFNAGSGDIFLISLKAGGTGLNLTGADVVIHYDPWWNPAVENQATDRAHRIGQDKHVQVFRLVTIGSIEEKIQDMQNAKQDLFDDIVEPGSTFINKLNMDDIKELFME